MPEGFGSQGAPVESEDEPGDALGILQPGWALVVVGDGVAACAAQDRRWRWTGSAWIRVSPMWRIWQGLGVAGAAWLVAVGTWLPVLAILAGRHGAANTLWFWGGVLGGIAAASTLALGAWDRLCRSGFGPPSSDGEVIATYPDDTPLPSRLVLGWLGDRPLHVVAADNDTDQVTVVITVYEPDPAIWEPRFKSRRKP